MHKLSILKKAKNPKKKCILMCPFLSRLTRLIVSFAGAVFKLPHEIPIVLFDGSDSMSALSLFAEHF